MKIGFVGYGKLGKPCADVIAAKGHEVYAYDVGRKEYEGVTPCNDIRELCAAATDIIFVAVPTPHDPAYDGNAPTAHLPPKDFDYATVKVVLKSLDVYATNQLIVLISTVLPGTVRRELVPLLTNKRFVYNPYLIAMGSVAWDMVNPEMVMIGTQDGSETGDAKVLVDFYKTIMENDPRYIVGTWDECECIKIFYNTFISAKLSLVNMIQDVAELQGNINVDVVTNALANSTMRIMGPQYMTAGMGDGGACHPRDNIALRHMAQELGLGYDLFDSIMTARERQAENLARRMVDLANEHNYPIYIHGKAYKPGVPYCDGSYSLLVGHYCEAHGFAPTYIDPLTDDNNTPDEPCVMLMAHSASTTYQYTDHQQQDQTYCEIPTGSVIIDPWRKFPKNNDYDVIYYGNTRNV